VSYTRGTDLSGGLEGAGGIGGLLARSSGYSGGNWTSHAYYHADGNGNITYLVNSNQTSAAIYRYDPYGNLISKSGTLADANVYRFSSKELHVNSGLYYYLYRFYSPNLQRWINRDPITESGFVLSVTGSSAGGIVLDSNPYLMVGNDPADYCDFFGLVRFETPCAPGHLAACTASCAAVGLVVKSCIDWSEKVILSTGYGIVFVHHWGMDCVCGSPPPPPAPEAPPAPPGPTNCKRNGPPPIIITSPPPPMKPPLIPPWPPSPPGGGRSWP